MASSMVSIDPVVRQKAEAILKDHSKTLDPIKEDYEGDGKLTENKLKTLENTPGV